VFRGRDRADAHAAAHLHESPRTMTGPLFVLAALSIVGGFAGLPEGFGMPNVLGAWLHPVLPVPASPALETAPAGAAAGLILATLLLTLAGIGLAWLLYGRRPEVPERIAAPTWLQRAMLRGYGVDALYQRAVVEPYRSLARACSAFDRTVIDGIVNGTGWTTLGSSYTSRAFDLGVVDGLVNLLARIAVSTSRTVRRLQTGIVQSYVTAVVFGLFVLVSAYLITSGRS